MGEENKPAGERCNLIAEPYSRLEVKVGAQPGEAPVSLPEPDELAEDFKNLKAWLDEFNSRVVATA